ncbi:hypothetical protein K450DRAFT_224691 [Umbelopsis ramanniana AG]|uniref:Trafficking protein particle complex subunit 2 n=1 Tax=Umbelopsis ramanniana AG TaxID=1314678 RepID=A0AAD5HHL7_UMBRA|nr:uncharacterized protein K450DRAFT_224691 [Umbelopsis ramanniana AG]KAI8583199.1 hypothetical protein K450DRAFT_224691 [Umbelopsis ramanniana AG]
MAATYYFAIVGTKDSPLYETELTSSSKAASNFDTTPKDDHRHLNQFIIHSALDVVEEVQWNNQALYLKVIDRFNEFYVSAFVTAGNARLLLLHDVKSEDSIKNFFNEVHEMYIKVLMNPFYETNTPITSQQFDSKVKFIARRFL